MDANTDTSGVIFEGDAPDKPKEYIRTLAGDMETVQKGGTPDLAPLTSPEATQGTALTEPTAREQLVAASPLAPVPAMVSPQAVQPAAPPVLPPRPLGPTPIKTYSSDFTQKVKETGATTATVLAAEQDSGVQPVQTEEEPVQSKKNLIYIIAGSALVIIGLGAAYFAYTHYVASPIPVITQGVSAPIFVDEKQEILGTGTLLLQAIEQSVSHQLASHTVRFIYTASSTTPGFDIFSLLPLSAPDILRRNVNAAGSMVGVVNSGSSQSPFFILSVATYRDTFAGMLSWESTMMESLALLFPAYPAPIAPIVATTTVATVSTSSPQATTQKKKTTATVKIKVATTTSTSSGQATTVFIAGFRDEVVTNHDVRTYRDASGRIVVMYGYWNQTTLIIARDAPAFTEILSRLATTHTQ